MKWTLFLLAVSYWSSPTSIIGMTGYETKDDCEAAKAVIAQQIDPELARSTRLVCWPPGRPAPK